MNTEPTLETIRACFEGRIPSFLATADPSGTPNMSEISQVQFVDANHVALSYQFFNKTRANILATRRAVVFVIDPTTNAQYRLYLDYIETQTQGPLFEAMRAKLAGIASHSGMQGVFKLLGSDVFRVRSIERVPSVTAPHAPAVNLLSAARRVVDEVAAATSDEVFDTALAAIARHFRFRYGMVFVLDRTSGRLFTLASRGYADTGIGAEVMLGQGVVGVAAAEGVAIRIGRMTTEYAYNSAVRDTAAEQGLPLPADTPVPYPGLPSPESQIAIPIRLAGQTVGVLFCESPDPDVFGYDEEDALALVAAQLGAVLASQSDDDPAPRHRTDQTGPKPDATIRLRHYAADNSVFVGNDYLIKGVAGAILWRMAQDHVATGRTEFTNRELRLDPSLRLPEYAENLEARLLLLQRRLAERNGPIRLERCGRGRLLLGVCGRLELEDVTL